MFVTGLSYDVCLRYVRTCKNNVSVNEDLEKFFSSFMYSSKLEDLIEEKVTKIPKERERLGEMLIGDKQAIETMIERSREDID